MSPNNKGDVILKGNIYSLLENGDHYNKLDYRTQSISIWGLSTEINLFEK